MADERTVALDCDQYEDLKEAVVKTIKAECAGGGSADNGQIMQKIAENTDALNRTTEQITALNNKFGKTDFSPVVKVQPPDMTDVNNAFQEIKDNSAETAGEVREIRNEIKTALSDEKIVQTVRLFVSREVERYKEILDGHWSRIDGVLENLRERIPYNYDINKRLVKWCI